MRVLVSCLLLVLSLDLAGCTAIPAVLPLETPASIEPDQGFLLVDVDANAAIHRVAFQPADRSWPRFFLENLPKGRSTRLIRVPAGEYRWGRVEIMGYTYYKRERPYIWEIDSSEDQWRFEVVAGTVSYPGVLVLSRQKRWLTSFTLNRSGEMAERLLRDGDWLLTQQPVVYTGRRRDDFLEYYSGKIADRRDENPSQEAQDAEE